MQRRTSIDQITRTIKKPLKFDPEGRIIPPRRTESIVGTHGTHYSTIVKLAEFGMFKGGDPLLEGRFFITANLKFKDWHKTSLACYLQDDDYNEAEPFDMGVKYSEVHNGKNIGDPDEGVVIAFNSRILYNDDRSYIQQSMNEDLAPELVLPKAPPIEAIYGIYPVGTFAANALMKGLNQLRLGILARS